MPLIYVRPEQRSARSSASTPVSERLETPRASIFEADGKIEQAYDAAEHGSPADVLLDHLAHELLCDAMRPIMSNEDEVILKSRSATPRKLGSHSSPVLTALEGAMALSLGSAIDGTLAEAFTLLDWAQDELEELGSQRRKGRARRSVDRLDALHGRSRRHRHQTEMHAPQAHEATAGRGRAR